MGSRLLEIRKRDDESKIKEAEKILRKYFTMDEIGLISAQIRERGYIPGYLYGCNKDEEGYEYNGREDIKLFENDELANVLHKFVFKHIYEEEVEGAKTEEELIEVYKRFDSANPGDHIKVIDLLSQGKTYEEIAEEFNRDEEEFKSPETRRSYTVETVKDLEARERGWIKKRLAMNQNPAYKRVAISLKERWNEEESVATVKEVLSCSMGADLHEAWRDTRKREDGSYEPRMKKSKDERWNEAHGTDDVDIANLSFGQLPSNWQYENLEAARVAIEQVWQKLMSFEKITEEMIEEMASNVHEAWLSRNAWVYDKEYGNPDQAKPYEELSEEEKAKDRAQIMQARQKVEAYQRGELDIDKLKEQFLLDARAKKEEELKKLQEEDEKCDEALEIAEQLDKNDSNKNQEGQTQSDE